MTKGLLTQTERFAALEALLGQPDASWSALMTLLAWWPPSQGQEQAVTLAEGAAGRWQDGERVLPRIGARHLLEGKVLPYLRLVRVLDMRPLYPVPSRVRLLSRMIREAKLRRLSAFYLRYDEGEAILREMLGQIEGLETLYLGCCSIGDTGAMALAREPGLAGLGSLSLHSNLISDKGALRLLESPHLEGLRVLNLYNNQVSPGVVEQIRSAPRWRDAHLLLEAQRASPA
jgi:hypothetical protein